MLLVSAVLLGIACIQCGHSPVAAASENTECPPKYPSAQLSNSCAPVPPWCKRLGDGASNWHQCQPRCRAFLQFGERRYRVVNWSDTNQAKVPVFSLALYGWRNRSLTIWRGKVYSRRSGNQGGAWKTVYQVDGRLVAVSAGAKPPYNCGKHSSGGGKSGRGQRKQLHGICRGNKCTIKLSLSRLMKKAALLRHRGGERGRKRKAELRFVLAYVGGRAQLVAGELRLVAAHSRGGQLEREEDPSETYRRFLVKRREEYWRKKGWKSGTGHSDAGAKKTPREPRTAKTKTRYRNQQRKNRAGSREQRKSKTAQSEDKSKSFNDSELEHLFAAFKD